MALRISNASGTFDLSKDFSTEIEDSSPIYNERGSQSIAATIPGTKNNFRLNGHIQRTDIDSAPVADERVTVADGVYHRIGKMNIVNTSEEGITFNVGFGESELYSIWNAVSLQSIKLPVYQPEGGVPELISYIFENRLNDDSPFCLFPVALTCNRKTENNTDTDYIEIINNIQNGYLWKARTETLIINGEPVEVSLPEGYGIVPFMKVRNILEAIFSTYGYTVVENPFASHHQLQQLVVLNNAADCCVKGVLKCANLMPDCTINEFMQALWCRFGLLYFVDGNTRTVRLKFIRDILKSNPSSDWTLLKASTPTTDFEAPQQLKLSASTNVRGQIPEWTAAPASESLDKFLKPYHYIVSTQAQGYLRYDKAYGFYYKTDNVSGRSELVSTDFFPWDRGVDMAYKEISSIDEFLPVYLERFKGNLYSYLYVPLYLFGKVHRYTTISSSDIELSENVDYQTPLAFCFSFFNKEYSLPYGSQICLDASGKPVLNKPNGQSCDISLLFVGKNGLFNHFWKEYDAILRHANHIITADMHLSAQQCMNPDFSSPILLDGQRMLPDTIRYSLPKTSSFPANVKLRTTKLLKPFNLEEEQTVPVTEQKYQWATFDNKNSVVEAAVKAQKDAWREEANREGNSLYDLQYQNVSTDAADLIVKVPLSVPTEEDYDNKREYFIRKVNYSFDLYYRIKVFVGSSPSGQIIYDISEPKGGVHYDLQYDLSVRAELL